MFRGRKLLIATKHHKEAVIAPLFEKEFGVSCFTTPNFDTDVFGTFSGEVERKNSAIETLREKCISAYQATQCDLVVASEGSFGPHPTLFFGNVNEELVMLKDFRNDIEIMAREISLETNFNGRTITHRTDLLDFAKQVDFPSHGIILKSTSKNTSKIYKGIVSEDDLIKRFDALELENKSVYAETDMRALFNPTRMKVIQKATQKLIEKIKNQCPNCGLPGLDINKSVSGLLCENCHLPTQSILKNIYQCKKCDFTEEKFYPRGITFEDPTYCDNCNP